MIIACVAALSAPSSPTQAREVLVTTDWVYENLKSPNVRLVEVSVDPGVYEQGHVQGAVGFEWHTELCRSGRARHRLAERRSRSSAASAGIANDTTVVLYGDNNNWFAAWGFWIFTMYGHANVQADGRRAQEVGAEKRPLDTSVAGLRPDELQGRGGGHRRCARGSPTWSQTVEKKDAVLVDVRSPDEYAGKIIAPPGIQELAIRAGHIPGANNMPWSKAVNDDGTFKSADELRKLYAEAGVDGTQADHHLLPDRRALEPHLVRAAGDPRLRRAQLRRLVDRVRQRRRRADRERGRHRLDRASSRSGWRCRSLGRAAMASPCAGRRCAAAGARRGCARGVLRCRIMARAAARFSRCSAARAFGVVLQRSRFCFASAFRDLFLLRDRRGLLGVLAALAVGQRRLRGRLRRRLPDPSPATCRRRRTSRPSAGTSCSAACPSASAWCSPAAASAATSTASAKARSSRRWRCSARSPASGSASWPGTRSTSPRSRRRRSVWLPQEPRLRRRARRAARRARGAGRAAALKCTALAPAPSEPIYLRAALRRVFVDGLAGMGRRRRRRGLGDAGLSCARAARRHRRARPRRAQLADGLGHRCRASCEGLDGSAGCRPPGERRGPLPERVFVIALVAGSLARGAARRASSGLRVRAPAELRARGRGRRAARLRRDDLARLHGRHAALRASWPSRSRAGSSALGLLAGAWAGGKLLRALA